MQTKEQTSKEYFMTLIIIHAMLLFGQVVFLVVLYYLVVAGQGGMSQELNDILQFVAPAFVIGGLIASALWVNKKLKSIKAKPELMDRLSEYRTVQIIRYALLEGPSLFALICFFLTGNFLFLAFAGIIILYFTINRPSRSKTSSDLELGIKERDLIEDPHSIILVARE